MVNHERSCQALQKQLAQDQQYDRRKRKRSPYFNESGYDSMRSSFSSEEESASEIEISGDETGMQCIGCCCCLLFVVVVCCCCLLLLFVVGVGVVGVGGVGGVVGVGGGGGW